MPQLKLHKSAIASIFAAGLLCGCNLFGTSTTTLPGEDTGAGESDAATNVATNDGGTLNATNPDGGGIPDMGPTPDMVVVEDFRIEGPESLRQGLVTQISIFTPGNSTRTVTLSSTGAQISTDGASWSTGFDLEVTANASIWLAVPMSAVVDEQVSVAAAFANRSATFSGNVVEGTFQTVEAGIDGETVEALDTLAVEAYDIPSLLPNQAVRSVRGVTVTPAASGFGAEIYLGINYEPTKVPTVHRFRPDVGTLVLLSDGATGTSPDENISQIRFSPGTSRFGEGLLLASASLEGGDGIFFVDGAGQMTRINSVNNATDLFVDTNNILGDLGYAEPLYVVGNGANLYEIAPGVTTGQDANRLVSNLGMQGGSRLTFAHPAGSFAGKLWVVQSNETDQPNSGYIGYYDADLAGVVNLASELEFPQSAVVADTGAMGDVMWVGLRDAETIDVFRADGTRYTAFRGLDTVDDLFFAEDEWLYFLENDVLWRIRPAGLP